MSIDVKARLTRDEQRSQNRTALIVAAQEAVARDGYDGLQLDAVAARVGLTKGAVYSIFGSKMELFVQAVAAMERSWAPSLDPAAGTGDARELLRTFVDGYLRLLASPELGRAMAFEQELAALSGRSEGVRQLVARMEAERVERLAHALTGRTTGGGEVLDVERAQDVSRLVLACLQGVLQLATTSGWRPAAEDLRRLLLAALQR